MVVIVREMGPLISGKPRLVKYYNLARIILTRGICSSLLGPYWISGRSRSSERPCGWGFSGRVGWVTPWQGWTQWPNDVKSLVIKNVNQVKEVCYFWDKRVVFRNPLQIFHKNSRISKLVGIDHLQNSIWNLQFLVLVFTVAKSTLSKRKI